MSCIWRSKVSQESKDYILLLGNLRGDLLLGNLGGDLLVEFYGKHSRVVLEGGIGNDDE
jgi:hypothetical protein